VPNPKNRPRLKIAEILRWADEHRRHAGSWPTRRSGSVRGSTHVDTWLIVDFALRQGTRGLHPGSSLARLLAEHCGKRNKGDLPRLRVKQILAWADVHHARTGSWPKTNSGAIADTLGETWAAVNRALVAGARGLPGGSSLAQFLTRKRGVAYSRDLPQLTIKKILGWADRHRAARGDWPSFTSGPVIGAPGETWSRIMGALRRGHRSLPAGGSLARLLFEKRAARKQPFLPRLTIKNILAWADAHHQRNARWPTIKSGLIPEAPGESWALVANALWMGLRSLPGRTTLARLLAKHRGVPNKNCLPPLTEKQILRWADAHRRRTGRWPRPHDGRLVEAPNESWNTVNKALRLGKRGLERGSSLARLLAQRRGARQLHRDPLDVKQILVWADKFHQRWKRWPIGESGAIDGMAKLTWLAIDMALRNGNRGLSGGCSLTCLLAKHRGIRNRSDLPRFTVRQIVAWTRAHYERTGTWPTAESGSVAESPSDTWNAVDSALKRGNRGLPGGSSLARLRPKVRRRTGEY
jgi:hypothetical protein